ncbi:MAG: caspase family protein, partial [Thermodesulfobacteriota bacterium]
MVGLIQVQRDAGNPLAACLKFGLLLELLNNLSRLSSNALANPSSLLCAAVVAFFTLIVSLHPVAILAADPDRATTVTKQSVEIAPAGVSSLPTGDLYAVIVGLSKYKNPKIPSLKLAAKDATDFAKFIETQEQLFRKTRVFLRTNENAGKTELEKYLFYELRQAGKDDTIVLFFSGHGAVDPKRPGEFFFLTYDADPEYLEATALNMTGLRFLRSLDCPRVVMIADACHSGGFTDWQARSSVIPLKLFLRDFTSSSGRVIITSSRPDEYSLEGSRMDNGVFTHFLIEGLKGAADKDGDGVISVKEAYDFVYDRTRAATGGAQHPQFTGSVEGVFPLSVSASFASRPPTVLEILTDPPGAEVYVSGKLVGQTEADGSLVVKHLPMGRPLPIKIMKKGWREASIAPVTFSRDMLHVTGQFVKLQPAGGVLELISDPPGAEVFVGHRLVGTTDRTGSIRLENLPLGEQLSVTVKKQGWQEASIGPITIPQDRPQVSGQRVKLKQILGSIMLITDPPDADIFLDGKPVGRTDQQGSLALNELPFGKKLSIKVKKEGWLEASLEPITLSPDKPHISGKKVELKRAAGTLELLTDPPDAEVYLGDKLAGKSKRDGSFVLGDLPIGQELPIKVKKKGWLEASVGPIVITPDKLHVKGARVKLAPARGLLELIVDPAPAEIYVGGKPAGETDKLGIFRLEDLPIDKPVSVKVKKKGWQEASLAPVTFSPENLQTKRSVKLEPARATLEILTDPDQVTVKLDGRYLGTTGRDGRLVVRAMQVQVPHALDFEKKGYKNEAMVLTIPEAAQGKTFESEKIRLVAKATPMDTVTPGKIKPAAEPQRAKEASREPASKPAAAKPSSAPKAGAEVTSERPSETSAKTGGEGALWGVPTVGRRAREQAELEGRSPASKPDSGSPAKDREPSTSQGTEGESKPSMGVPSEDRQW